MNVLFLFYLDDGKSILHFLNVFVVVLFEKQTRGVLENKQTKTIVLLNQSTRKIKLKEDEFQLNKYK